MVDPSSARRVDLNDTRRDAMSSGVEVMSSFSPTSQPIWRRIAFGPWGLLLAAFAVALIGAEVGKAGSEAVQALSTLAGLIATGSAVAWRLQNCSYEFDSRI